MKIDKKVLERIEKCFTLANESANPNEAKNALAKAMKLLKKYSLNEDDLVDVKLDCQLADSIVQSNPKQHVSTLAERVAQCYSVLLHYTTYRVEGKLNRTTRCQFSGEKSNVMMSVYTFDFLHRSMKIAEKEYKKKLAQECFDNTGMKLSLLSSKIKRDVRERVDGYLLFWVDAVVENLAQEEITKEDETLITKYLTRNSENGTDFDDIKEAKVKKVTQISQCDMDAGIEDGSKVNVHTPISGHEQQKLGVVKEV
ncbi:DUF2786 domain-containing protein [Photobacterium leiognathi]|uniref:DUF2786 domain-containing protein n=1 Tax=Photobacterium leiognathi TaxID=553611 RepID=UPI002981A6BB|nr:DUF2786 domain-containing protein [Photobacterium leiognathi]